jgi:hypothetical protein
MGCYAVTAMLEEPPSVACRHHVESSAHRLYERLAGTHPGPPQEDLELGKRFFDEPTTVRLYTRASSSGYTIILSSQLDPLPVSMVSARQFMQPAKPFELRFVGPHYPASSVTGRLPAADPSPTNPRI